MRFESYDSMIDSVMLKERHDEILDEREAENSSDYYYDDSTGYRIYNPESEDEDDDESEDEE